MTNYFFGKNIIPENDPQRVAALKKYQIIDTEPEDVFDYVVQLATKIFKVPISLVSLVDTHKVFYKANVGIKGATGAERASSFCSMTLLSPEVTVIENALEDPALSLHPDVAGGFGLQFYAGAPLITPEGFQIGTICLVDRQARTFTDHDREILAGLAKVVMHEIEIRRTAIEKAGQAQSVLEELGSTNEELAASNEELTTINEELLQTQQSLNKLNDHLEQLVEERTKQVISERENYEKINEHLSLAVTAANLGIWHIHPETKALIYNPTLAKIFGYEGQEPMTYGQAIAQVSDEYRDQILLEIEKAIAGGGDYDITYQQRRFNDNELIWLRSSGKVLADEQGNHTIFSGVVRDITNVVLSREGLTHANNDLLAANANLAASNEELAAANKDLVEARDMLNETLNRLTISESRLRYLISDSPIAIAVFSGKEMLIESANKLVLEAWGKNPDVIGKPLVEAVPELTGQQFLDLLDNVFTHGEPYFGNEVKALIEKNGVIEELYSNFVYQPLKDEANNVDGIMLTATIITEQVKARKELEQVYEQARLSKEAAQLGTFDMDMKKGTMEWDKRCRLLFGINHDGNVTYEKDFVTGLHPDDRDRIINIIKNVFIRSKTNGVYDVEYRTIGAEDQKLRWVRAKGQAYFDENENPVRFIGSVLDITEQKQDELRKNDFIGMVSHELKTPLTSLTAIIQVLNGKFKQDTDAFISNSLSRANVQVKKMNNMVNGFLNISRLESGKMQMEKAEFNIDELVANVITDAQFTSPGHFITLKQCDAIQIIADQDKISSVISNLLSNAVKYSPKGKPIEVECIKQLETVRVNVKDEGIGIAEQDVEPLFDRYYRVENPNYKHISGFGIGLYLSAEIIRSHGGHIGVDSKLGKGSTFYFELPLKK